MLLGGNVLKKEGEIMDRVMNRMNDAQIPPHIQKEMGLKKNWKKQISPQFANSALKNAEKFKDALRKLSKN